MTSVCAPESSFSLEKATQVCARVPWLHPAARAYMAASAVRHAPPVFVNVGANKGYKLVEFAALWSSSTHVPVSRWLLAIERYAAAQKSNHLNWNKCGSCLECKTVYPTDQIVAKYPPTMHALELSRVNRELLRHLLSATGLGNHAVVHDLAVSNESGAVASKHTTGYIGWERNGIVLPAERKWLLQKKKLKKQSQGVAIENATTLDDFFQAQQLNEVCGRSLATHTRGRAGH